MGIYSTKPRWQHALRPVVMFCARHDVRPNVFTYGALALSLLAAFGLFEAGSSRFWLAVVPPAVSLRLLFNLMDGLVARELKLADALGEVKNEFGDRIADAAIFLGITFGGYADARLGALAIVLILFVSYLGILAKATGSVRVYAGIFGKGDRMITLAAFTFYPLVTGDLASYNSYLAFAALMATITIVQRLRIIYGPAKSAR